jgi:hypothetical protein
LLESVSPTGGNLRGTWLDRHHGKPVRFDCGKGGLGNCALFSLCQFSGPCVAFDFPDKCMVNPPRHRFD